MSTPSTPSTPDVPRDDTLATEVFDAATTPVATAGANTTTIANTATTTPATATATDTPAAPALPEPVYLSGPAPFAVVLGILGLLFAAATFFFQVTDVTLPGAHLGPWTVVAVGLVVVLVGAIGLRGSRTRD